MKERPLFPIYDILEHWAAFAYTTPEVRPVHHALYHALVYMCKRRGGAHRFTLHYRDGMQACGIAARNTYVAALRELEQWGFVAYTPGANAVKAAIVDVKFCASTEQALSIWRSSHYASDCASNEHIIKEVKRLKEVDEEKSVVVKNLEDEVADLKTQLLKAQQELLDRPVVLASQPGGQPAIKAAALANSEPEDEQLWNVGPLTKPDAFKAICDRLGHEGIAYEKYRKQALVAAEDNKVSRTIAQWNSWIRKYLENQQRDGPLTKQAADMPTEPTPRNQLPQPGQERAGQIIAIEGVPNDDSLNRIKVAAYQKHYPTAIIHAIR